MFAESRFGGKAAEKEKKEATVKMDEETKESINVYLQSWHKILEESEAPKAEKDSLAEAIKQLDLEENFREIYRWLKLPTPNEENLIKKKDELKKEKNKKNKGELCAIESQLHTYLIPRLKLIGKLERFDNRRKEKEI